MSTSQSSDRGIGLTILFGLLAVGAAVGTFAAPSQELAAYAFGAAVTLGVLVVAAIHLYW
jgi:hypothetical protein